MPIRAEVEALVAGRAQESQHLEFKRAASLSRGDRERRELIKDVTGFANADGGRIVYGVEEAVVGGSTFATSFDPVTDPNVTRDLIYQVVAANTVPPLRQYQVHEVVIEPGERLFVIDIDASGTAHQSSIDHRYYQRLGTQTKPMLDFQIRDVMARRTAPSVEFELTVTRRDVRDEVHHYRYGPQIDNTGLVTMGRAFFELDIPEDAGPNQVAQIGDHSVWNMSREMIGRTFYLRFGIALPELHPGQRLVIDKRGRTNTLAVQIDNASFGRMRVSSPPIRWRIYWPDAAPAQGEVSFDQWCQY